MWNWLQRHVAGNGPIRHIHVVDVRESMANGGGPACLRLRVVADPATVDPRFLATPERLDRIEAVVRTSWPETIDQSNIGDHSLIEQVQRARNSLLQAMGLVELIDS